MFIENVNQILGTISWSCSWIYIDSDELPGAEVAPGSINYLGIGPKKEHQEAPFGLGGGDADSIGFGTINFGA